VELTVSGVMRRLPRLAVGTRNGVGSQATSGEVASDTHTVETETRPMDEHPNAKILRELNERMKDGDFQAGFDILADDVEWYEIGRDEPTRGKEELGRRYQESVGDFEIKTDMHNVLANDEHAVQLMKRHRHAGRQDAPVSDRRDLPHEGRKDHCSLGLLRRHRSHRRILRLGRLKRIGGTPRAVWSARGPVHGEVRATTSPSSITSPMNCVVHLGQLLLQIGVRVTSRKLHPASDQTTVSRLRATENDQPVPGSSLPAVWCEAQRGMVRGMNSG
jgi:hypothetical protein